MVVKVALNFKMKLFKLFLFLFKQRNPYKDIYLYNYTNIYFIKNWYKPYIYIYYLKLIGLKINIINLLENCILYKDYYLLYVLEYFNTYQVLPRKNSAMFNQFNYKPIVYQNFTIRVPFYLYLSLGSYVEYFRYFKYLEYLKCALLAPEIKKSLHEHTYYKMPLWRQHSINLCEDMYIFYTKKFSVQLANYRLIFNNNLLKIKGSLFLFWQYIYLLPFYSIRFYNLMLNFFHLSLTVFCYKTLMSFTTQLKIYNTYKSINPFTMFISLRRARFKYARWIIIYFLKHFVLSNLRMSESDFFLRGISDCSWLYAIKSVLFEVFHESHFHRILLQFDKERHGQLTPLFLLLWELFVDWYYFGFDSFETYYNELEYSYWILLIKYNLERLLCEAFSRPLINLKSQIIIKKANMYFHKQFFFINHLFKLNYQKYFQKVRFNKGGKNLFLGMQFDNSFFFFFTKNSYLIKDDYNFFKATQFKQRKLVFWLLVKSHKSIIFLKENYRFV